MVLFWVLGAGHEPVQQCCAKDRHIINAAFIGKHVGQRDQMVDVVRSITECQVGIGGRKILTRKKS